MTGPSCQLWSLGIAGGYQILKALNTSVMARAQTDAVQMMSCVEVILEGVGLSQGCWEAWLDLLALQVIGSPGEACKCAAPLLEPLHQYDDQGPDLSLF